MTAELGLPGHAYSSHSRPDSPTAELVSELDFKGDPYEALYTFARIQVETCPDLEVDRKRRLLHDIGDRHPVDSIPYLIANEPTLFLSNLDFGNATKLLGLMEDIKDIGITAVNVPKVARAIYTIQGYLVGLASAKKQE
jgi:hypothetical protein